MKPPKMINVHFLSMRLDWNTPKQFYDELNKEFNFDFDPCPKKPTFNGLEVEWKSSNFVNPPYGREIGKWTQKAIDEWKKGKIVVMLIPSRTDTIWWHRDIMQATEIRFIKGRLKFDDQKNPAPFPSAVAIFSTTKPSYILLSEHEKEVEKVFNKFSDKFLMMRKEQAGQLAERDKIIEDLVKKQENPKTTKW